MRLAELFTLARTLGADRHGIVTALELRLAGADPDTVKLALERHWQAAVRSVYVPHRDSLTQEELAHVGVAHAGPGAVVSGLLGARALGMRWVPDDLPGVVILVEPHVRRVRSTGLILVRRCAALSGMRTTPWQGVQLAAPEQIVVDACRQVLVLRTAEWAARTTPPRTTPARMTSVRREHFERAVLQDIRGIVLGAVADKHCTAAEVLAVLDAGSIRDSALIRRACRDAQRGAASPPEAELADGLFALGVPFACNVEVWNGDVLLAVLDALLLGTGVGAELDSKEVHEAADLLDATLTRHGRVERGGVKLCHITPSRYRRAPAAFHAELCEEVLLRQSRGVGDPPGLRLVLRGPVLCGPRNGRQPYRPTDWALEAARLGRLPDAPPRAA